MKYFTGIEPPLYDEDSDPFVKTLGTWAHNWLARISPHDAGNLAPFPTAAEFATAVRAAANDTRAQIEAVVTSTGRELPAWWFSVWNQAAYASGKLAGIVGEVEGWSHAAGEFKLKPPVEVVLANGTLRIHGRIDLLLSDRPNARPRDFSGCKLWVIDYKTGGMGEMKKSKLEQGHGFQLALYALALRQLGADEVGMTILKPDIAAQYQLKSSDLSELSRIWEELCRMQDGGVFGALGDMRSEFGRGAVYPLATLDIDIDLLFEKWEKTHPGFVRGGRRR